MLSVLCPPPLVFPYLFCTQQPNFWQPTPLSKGFPQAARVHRGLETPTHPQPPKWLVGVGYKCSIPTIHRSQWFSGVFYAICWSFSVGISCADRRVSCLVTGPTGCFPFLSHLPTPLPVYLHLPNQFWGSSAFVSGPALGRNYPLRREQIEWGTGLPAVSTYKNVVQSEANTARYCLDHRDMGVCYFILYPICMQCFEVTSKV